MVTKVTLEYDGSSFAGWARQPGERTVQEELERALRTVLGDDASDGGPLCVTVAGRTDRGVHAWAQVASYEHEAVRPARLNGLLPGDIAVLACEPAADGFDARRDARSRTYCYRILNRRTRSALERRRSLWWPRELDVAALERCAQALTGQHDFRAFTPTETQHARFSRHVIDARWRQTGEILEFWIEADSFLRHMNRVLVGTMLDVASGRLDVERFRSLLDGASRGDAGACAPPHALALARVSY